MTLQREGAILLSGLENYQQLLNMIRGSELDIRLIMLRVENGEDALNVLDKMDIDDKEDKKIIVDLPTPECKYLLDKKVMSIIKRMKAIIPYLE